MTLQKTKILTSASLIAFLLLSFGAYGLYKAKAFLEGPKIIIASPTNGEGVEEAYTEITGKAINVSNIFLNGRQISTDKEGNFKGNLLLASGYNIIEVSGMDKFGRQVKEILELVYK